MDHSKKEQDARVLRALEDSNGAFLYWQTEDRDAFEDARERGVIFFDAETDCYIHPWVVKVDGGYIMGPGPAARFLCHWGAGYGDAQDEVRAFDSFSDANGYSLDAVTALAGLAVGESFDLTDLGGEHTVQRVADVVQS